MGSNLAADMDLGEELISPQQLADELGLPIKSVYNWNSNGLAPRRIRVGRSVRYRRSDVRAWLAAREVG